jgi:hypothetical protein
MVKKRVLYMVETDRNTLYKCINEFTRRNVYGANCKIMFDAIYAFLKMGNVTEAEMKVVYEKIKLYLSAYSYTYHHINLKESDVKKKVLKIVYKYFMQNLATISTNILHDIIKSKHFDLEDLLDGRKITNRIGTAITEVYGTYNSFELVTSTHNIKNVTLLHDVYVPVTGGNFSQMIKFAKFMQNEFTDFFKHHECTYDMYAKISDCPGALYYLSGIPEVAKHMSKLSVKTVQPKRVSTYYPGIIIALLQQKKLVTSGLLLHVLTNIKPSPYSDGGGYYGRLYSDYTVNYRELVWNIVSEMMQRGATLNYNHLRELIRIGVNVPDIKKYNIELGDDFSFICAKYKCIAYNDLLKFNIKGIEELFRVSAPIKHIREVLQISGIKPNIKCLELACNRTCTKPVVELLINKYNLCATLEILRSILCQNMTGAKKCIYDSFKNQYMKDMTELEELRKMRDNLNMDISDDDISDDASEKKNKSKKPIKSIRRKAKENMKDINDKN